MSVDLCGVTEPIKNKGIDVTEIRRLIKRHTGKPTQIVRDCFEQLLNTWLVLNNKQCQVLNNKQCQIEKERVIRVICCFKCQSLRHLVKHCKGVRHCEICVLRHMVKTTVVQVKFSATIVVAIILLLVQGARLILPGTKFLQNNIQSISTSLLDE